MRIAKKWVVALGAVAVLGSGAAVADAWLYVKRATPPSGRSMPQELAAFEVPASWIKSGQPRFSVTEVSRSTDGRQIVGLWQCDGPTTFEWQFGLDETVHLLEGEVKVEYLGNTFTLLPGQTATFHAGTRATWHIPNMAKKVFSLEHPGRLALLWRRLMPQAPAAS